tara:strand:+ start:43 stop:249 length:207 start_codon:yes stop_codon:yes gene_type:complete
MDKTIAQETNKINIVPTYENLFITYVRLYSKMNEGGKKQIEIEFSKYAKRLKAYDKVLLNDLNNKDGK